MHSLNFCGPLGIVALLLSTCAFAAEKSTTPQLIELAKSNSPALRDAVSGTFDGKELKEGTAWIARGPDFFFATQAASQPALFIGHNDRFHDAPVATYAGTPSAAGPAMRFTSNMVTSSSVNCGSTSAFRFSIICPALSTKASRKRFSGCSP